MYRNFGLMKNMGGLGARSELDYETLVTFCDDPSISKETLELKCVQRNAMLARKHQPVKLVVFDFDETLTLATFPPEDDAFRSSLDWNPEVLRESEWSAEELVKYNFETPFVATGNRLHKLRCMLAELENCTGGDRITLAVLTRNEHGAVSVLNFLRMAGLDSYFSAIWTLPYSVHHPAAVFRAGREWRTFEPPIVQLPDHKANVLRDVSQHTAKWLPQLAMKEAMEHYPHLFHLPLECIVLVDDERAHFQNNSQENPASLVRYCKVPRYDEIYRNCGPLNQMGGIGAHSDADYESLLAFVRTPWGFAQDAGDSLETDVVDLETTNLQREGEVEEEFKVLRVRRAKSLSNPELATLGREVPVMKRVSSSPVMSPSMGYAPSPGVPDLDLIALDGNGEAADL